MNRMPYARVVFGEIHGMVESFVNFVHGEATVEEIAAGTSISLVDLHHAVADMAACRMCSVTDGTVLLIVPPAPLAALVAEALA